MSRIAVAHWNDRVSPVLDSAGEVMVVDTGNENGERSIVRFSCAGMAQRVRRLRELNVDTVICGAVSNPFRRMIEASGIKVRPWVSGTVDSVLEAYLSGSLKDDRYAMPGRRGGRGPRYRGGRGADVR